MERPPSRSKRKTPPGPAARALRLLARRDHTRLELERKLAPHVANPDELGALLDDFTVRGWLSEARVAEQVVHAKRARFGAARIRHALVGKGVPGELIDSALESLKGTELEAARAVWARKFKVLPATAAGRAKQVRFLQSRGFSAGVALRVVRGEPGDGD